MKSGISEIIGQAIFDGGSQSAAAYRALRPLACASCGGLIAVGEMFTRIKTEGEDVRLWPRCRTCSPFTLQTAGQARSPLLESLLAPQAAKSEEEKEEAEAQHGRETQAADERQKIFKAMRQRLGPALARARRSRSGKR